MHSTELCVINAFGVHFANVQRGRTTGGADAERVHYTQYDRFVTD